LYVEGCYDEGIDGVRGPRFYDQKKPTSLGVAAVSEVISKKIIKYLIKKEYLKAEDDFCEPVEIEDESMDVFHKTSIYGYIATGEHEGYRVRRLRGFDLDGKAEITGNRCVSINGFSVHADTFIKKHEHQQRERLIRYVARPPISEKRMELDENGEVIWHLKNIFSDGTEALKFSPMELIEKLASIIPPPWKNLIRYFGFFTGNSKIREAVVLGNPKKRDSNCSTHQLYYIPWAELLKRTFGIDIRACHNCGGRLQFIAAIFDGSAVGKISDYLGIYQGSDPPLLLQSQTEYDEYFD